MKTCEKTLIATIISDALPNTFLGIYWNRVAHRLEDHNGEIIESVPVTSIRQARAICRAWYATRAYHDSFCLCLREVRSSQTEEALTE